MNKQQLSKAKDILWKLSYIKLEPEPTLAELREIAIKQAMDIFVEECHPVREPS